MKDLEKKARAYALKNAVAYDGVARTGSVISALFNEGLKPSEVKKFSKQINNIVAEVNKLPVEEQIKEFSKLESKTSHREGREGLPELPGAKKGKVIMRFAPSASGPFHIGHALTGSLSYLFVKKYGGKFYLRIEDTNPENIYPKAYEMIKKESAWLFPGNFLKIIIQSDRMKIYYNCAEKLLRKKAAYVCTCSQEKFKEFVEAMKACPCRSLSVKENLERWKKMLDKNGFAEGQAVLRFKSGMQDKNPAMRDFPLARINLTKHVRQGNRYRVWPLMNLAVAADDIDLKMTHIIRAKDHRDNAERQRRIYLALGLKSRVPWTGFLGRIHLKDMELSTTKMRQDIESGKYSGWNDKRLPTIASLKKQGYKPEAFWKFAERIGLSENDKIMDREEFFKLLDSFNKE
ncbi:MAG TPA: glutamate--tRNA ligase family protein [Candidatus Nanoarchaeia archaeon]|nr:glutamate--tRNA ligase family protein [Candidatus Nanoarchaeia archaeon]